MRVLKGTEIDNESGLAAAGKVIVIQNEEGWYFCGKGWASDIRRAYVHTVPDAHATIRRLRQGDRFAGLSLDYRIQDYRELLRFTPSRATRYGKLSKAGFRYGLRQRRSASLSPSQSESAPNGQ